MSKEENLDFILNICKRYNTQKNVTSEEWHHELNKIQIKIQDTKPNCPLTDMYFNFLLQDGMIEPFCQFNPTDYKAYRLTFKGYFFDGYEKTAKNKNTIYRRDRLTIKILNLGAIGGLIAGVYAAFQIYRDIFHPIQTGGETIVKQIGIFF